MSAADSFPRQSARTRRFTLGEPRSFTVCADGARLLFLRSLGGSDPRTALWVIDLPDGEERLVVDPQSLEDDVPASERARRERVRENATGVVAYSADRAGQRVAFAAGGALRLVDVDSGEQHVVADAAVVFDPHIDPTGQRVAYVGGRALWLVEVAEGTPRVLADDPAETVSWGRAEHIAAEEMGRYRGFWWSPDGTMLMAARVDETAVDVRWISDPAHPERAPTPLRYPAAGTANADVTVHIIGIDGSRTPVAWDVTALPYLARVHWSPGGPPLLQVQSRDQRRVVTLAVDASDGSTRQLHVDTDPVWVELFDGVPDWWGDAVVRIADADGGRRLMVDDRAVTPPDVCVRAVAGCDDTGVVFTASYDDPTQVHVLRWGREGVEAVTSEPGVHGASAGDGVVVVASASMDHFGRSFEVRTRTASRSLRSVAETPAVAPAVRMLTVGARDLRVGLVLPQHHEPGHRWPVLLSPYGGPHAQRVLSARGAWLEAQWLADQGFAVVVADGRGTPGRDPSWEREIHHALTLTLDDQVDALQGVAEVEPALDLARVGIRGWSYGGYLAAMAVLRRPEVFHAAVAGAPVTDWSLYDTHYTERYLGRPQDEPHVYTANSLLDDAPRLTRPLLIVHGLADDNVVAAHTLLLSQRLTESGRPHAVLPLTGVTHMTPQEAVAENLLVLQVQFLRDVLG
jgi:dipeptidyl-peptidase-4